MKKQLPVVGCVLIYLAIVVVPIALSAETVSKPTVTLPANWHLKSETPYPEEYGNYDPEGAGMLKYEDEVDDDVVMIFYERAPTYTLTETALESKVTEIFERDHEYTPYETGTMTVAGSIAGYAKGYNSSYNFYQLELVFVKADVFLNVYALYDATVADEAEVMSLINSISVPVPQAIPVLLIVVVLIIVAIIVIPVVVLIILKRRRKPAEPIPPQPVPLQQVPESSAPARFCMGCGNRLAAKGATCKKCGESPADFGGPETRTCHCGAVIPSTAKFCSQCGGIQAPTEGEASG